MGKIQWTTLQPSETGYGHVIPGQPKAVRKPPFVFRPWLAETATWCSNKIRHRIHSAINHYHTMKNEFVTNLTSEDTAQLSVWAYHYDTAKFKVGKIAASIVWHIDWQTDKSGITGYKVKVDSLSIFIDLECLPGITDVMPKTDTINLIKQGFDVEANINFRHTESSHKLSPIRLHVNFLKKLAKID